MLNDRYVREHPDAVRAGLHRRHAGADAERAHDEWQALDAERRALAARHDALARSRRDMPAEPADESRHREQERKEAADALAAIEARARALLLQLPNLPDVRVPEGAGPQDNVELRRWGKPP